MRITSNKTPSISTTDTLAYSARQIAEFIKLSPEEHRKVAQLICSISDVEVIGKFVTAVKNNEFSDFTDYCNQKQIPMSTISDLLALSQELEANSREKLDALVLKAKRGLVKLTKQALQKAILLLV